MKNYRVQNIRVISLEDYNTSLLEEMIDTDSDGFSCTTQTVFSMEEFAKFGKIFLLYEDNKLIGVSEFLKDWNDNDKVYLYGMSIRKNKQNKGFGTKFLEEMINKLRQYNIKKIALYVDPNNKTALHLYKHKFGFKEIEYSRYVYNKGKNRLLLELNIAQNK